MAIVCVLSRVAGLPVSEELLGSEWALAPELMHLNPKVVVGSRYYKDGLDPVKLSRR